MKQLLILGAGPAGLAASIYASRYKIDHAVVGLEVGGYLNEIHHIENYPGFEGISGMDLAQNFQNHAEKLGGEIIMDVGEKIEKIDQGFRITLGSGDQLEARVVLYCIGTSHRKLEIPGEADFLGRGVSYCATCDGPFFKKKTVAVVGGGNSAAGAALILASHAKKVFLIHRGPELRANPTYQEQITQENNIEVIYNTNVLEILGKEKLEQVRLDKEFQGGPDLALEGLFIEIGSVPNVKMLQTLQVEANPQGYVKTKADQSTSVPGLYAAGDITTNSNGFRQIITAAAEGAVAVEAIFRYLKD